MTEASSRRGFLRGARPAALAGGLVFTAGAVAGVAVPPGFLLLAALGAFGPALLRETGLLHDQDEFLLIPLGAVGVGLLRARSEPGEPSDGATP